MRSEYLSSWVSRSLVGLAVLLGSMWFLQSDVDAQGLSVTVDPSTDLADGQRVVATVAGASKNGAFLGQCVADAKSFTDCDPSTFTYANGGHGNGTTATVRLVVWRESVMGADVIDCAATDCVVVALDPSSGTFNILASVPLGFDPDVAPPTTPQVKVRPQAGLVDEQAVKLRTAGWIPFTPFSVTQCVSGPATGCSRSQDGYAEADGTFRMDFAVSRSLPDDRTGQPHDCADGGCYLSISTLGTKTPHPVPLAFDADEPTPPGIKVVVFPRKALVDLQEVTVRVESGEGRFFARQCAILSDQPICRYLGQLQSGPVGGESQASETFRIRRNISVGAHGGPTLTADCAVEKCVIRVDGTDDSAASRKIIFDADTTATRPTVKIASRNNIVANRAATITVAKSLAQFVEVNQCPRDATTHDDARCTNVGSHFRDHDGTPGLEAFTFEIFPTRYLDSGAIDCRDRKSCDLRVFGSEGPMRRLLINFGSDASRESAMRVTPRRQLLDRQSVTVKVKDLEQDWWISQCLRGADLNSHSGCQYGELLDFEVTDSGSQATVEVRRVLSGTDCASEPGLCELQLFVRGLPRDSVPLRFNRQATLPDPVTLTIEPPDALVDSQTVRATVTNLPGDDWQFSQCLPSDLAIIDHFDNCRAVERSPSEPTDPDNLEDGPRVFDVEVSRAIGLTDCAVQPSPCELVVFSYRDGVVANAPLLFDPEGPEPAGPSVAVRPRRGLSDGQLVSVTMEQFTFPEVRQCAFIDGAVAEGTCRTFSNGYSSDDSGTATTEGIVRRILMPAGAKTGWDCAEVARSCVIQVRESHGSGLATVERRIALTFDPDAPAIIYGPAALEVSKSTDLADGSRVQVTVTGLIPQSGVSFFRCIATTSDALSIQESCDLAEGWGTEANSGGRARVSMVVNHTILGQSCAAVVCVILAIDDNGTELARSVRLNFR